MIPRLKWEGMACLLTKDDIKYKTSSRLYALMAEQEGYRYVGKYYVSHDKFFNARPLPKELRPTKKADRDKAKVLLRLQGVKV